MADALDELLEEEEVEGYDGDESVEGDEDVIGYDDVGQMSNEEIGRIARRRMSRRGRGRSRRRQPKRADMFVTTEDIGRLAPIGIGVSTSIAAAATQLFQGTVERPAHIRRLLITASVSVDELAIIALKMGDVDQLLTGEVPASLYDSNAQQGFPDNFSPLRQNATASITIRNDGAAANVTAIGGKAAVNR